MRGRRPSWSQSQVIGEYDRHTGADGGFDPLKLIEVWKGDARLKRLAGVFENPPYRFRGLPIGGEPVLIAYNHLDARTRMNVIFGQVTPASRDTDPCGQTANAWRPGRGSAASDLR